MAIIMINRTSRRRATTPPTALLIIHTKSHPPEPSEVVPAVSVCVELLTEIAVTIYDYSQVVSAVGIIVSVC